MSGLFLPTFVNAAELQHKERSNRHNRVAAPTEGIEWQWQTSPEAELQNSKADSCLTAEAAAG